MRLLRHLLVAGVLVLVILTGLVAGSMLLSPRCAALAARSEPFDVAIVLSRGMDGHGGLDAGSQDRTDAAIGLYRRGLVRELLMTGDVIPGPDSAAARMRDRAVAGGVPPERVTIETESHSTLQNALFSLPLIEDGARVIVVTEGFHLWRGWASLAWAGDPPDGLCQSSPVVPRDLQTIRNNLPREVAAWGANITRASIYSVAQGFGRSDLLSPAFLE